MALRDLYVVHVRDRGLFLVEPVPGLDQRTIVEGTLDLKGGYSTGLASIDLPDQRGKNGEVWVGWVELETGTDLPYYEYIAADGTLSEKQATQVFQQTGEPLKMNKSKIYAYTPPNKK